MAAHLRYNIIEANIINLCVSVFADEQVKQKPSPLVYGMCVNGNAVYLPSVHAELTYSNLCVNP